MILNDETTKDLLKKLLIFKDRRIGLKLIQEWYGHCFLSEARNNGSQVEQYKEVNNLLCRALKLINDHDL